MAATHTWYYQKESGVVGPISAAELKRLVEQGVVRPTTRIRRGEDGSWFPSEGIQVVLDSAVATESTPTPGGEPADWYFSLQDKRKLGPVTRPTLENMLRQGKLLPIDLVWCAGMAAWAPASEVFGPLDAAKPLPRGHIEKPAAVPPPSGPPPLVGTDKPSGPPPPPLVGIQKAAGPPRRTGIKKPRPVSPTGRMADWRVVLGGSAAGVFLLGVISVVGWNSLRTATGNPAGDRTAPRSDPPIVVVRVPPAQPKAVAPVKSPMIVTKFPTNADAERLYDEAVSALRRGDHLRARTLLQQYAALPNAPQADAARGLIGEIELATSPAKADELAEDLSDEQLQKYLRDGVGPLVVSAMRTPELRPLYTRTLRQALDQENRERQLVAKNDATPVQANHPAESPNTPRSGPTNVLKTAETPKAKPATPQIPNAGREFPRGSSKESYTLDKILDAPADYEGQTLVADGLYKIGTRLYNVKGPDGNPVGWSLPVTRADGGRICNGEAKAVGRDTYLLLEDGLADFLTRVLGKLQLRTTVKAVHKCILTVAIRQPAGKRDHSPVVYITALEILGTCDLYKVITNQYDNAFVTARISLGNAAVGRGDGLAWVERLGGEEKYVQPLRSKYREIQRRQKDRRDQVMVDRYLQAEHFKVMAIAGAAQYQQDRAFAAWMGRRIFP